ncbi:ECF-type riboflavin transporter substrate-binding protein [Enterococcus columbae]|uniref:UPF0397 protein I568_02290 n=1 Tax=Enterococcus columbae DSM 7374 = ATCC 51263 TaxID=1121865 RepID=S0KG47_9ENTE|nr:ECF-type riboflavin transporter substrate-binding protein [Enterococcus columbae]EOT39128.1 hypothetical protein OMW_02005 [Enterococcus columbae DSM 7374 = ATCC 51263]EOW79939.1 hypothetical protein I568_02290 [Enterococcus columbae DSM 7374 = ATCC 51263]
MKKGNSIQAIVAIGIGAAIYFVLARYVAIPTPVPNTTLQTSYGFLALIASVFGPIVGGLVGFLGHTLTDMTLYGPWWSWIVCSGICGVCYGFIGKFLSVTKGIFGVKDAIIFNIGQIVTNIVAWGVIAPSLDILIYSEPANKVYLQGLTSAALNSISVAIIGTILLYSYAKTRVQKGSLSKEND